MTQKASDNSQTDREELSASRLRETPIAIVGMASVFASSENLEAYWDNILEKVDAIMEVPPSRWAVDDYYDADKSAEDKTYCKRGGFIPELDFDPMAFGLPPNILELTDISQLLSLVVAKEVLQDAGLSDQEDLDRVGIVLGVGGGQKQVTALSARLQAPVLDKVLAASGVNEADRQMIIGKFQKAYIPWQENSFPGLLGNVIAGRIANRFNLGGTNCVVDAACAGSLAALKVAINDLLDYRSDVMISGGVCCDNSPFMYLSFSKTPAFTDDEKIRPFDESSRGMMIGEGIGMLAFKRLEDAERDGDKIYAVLKGLGSSSDGRSKSIYAPRSSGQAKALNRAYQDAGFAPSSVGLIEAHGTGTLAGDAAEFGGLREVFQSEDEQQHIALGSVKSQVGHTKAAAGAAGLIKVALALHHKVLPPTINVDQPAEVLDIEHSPFYLNTETRPWFRKISGEPRRAGVSSFGFGGTNFHAVLEEYQPGASSGYRLQKVPQSVVLKATSKQDLQTLVGQTIAALNQEDKTLAAVAFNRLVKEQQHPQPDEPRLGLVAKDAESAVAALEKVQKALSKAEDSWSLPGGIFYRQKALPKQKTAALFSGQGSQYVNMGRALLTAFPDYLAHAEAMDSLFARENSTLLSGVTYPKPVFNKAAREEQETLLRQTRHAQPAIGLLSASLYDTFRKSGLQVDAVAGHSFGELTALYAAEVVDRETFFAMAIARGKAMSAPADDFDAGSMLAVIADKATVKAGIADIQDVSIANINAPDQVVVAGVTEQVKKAQKVFKSQGIKAVLLPVSAAFHTPLVAHAHGPFADHLKTVDFSTPKLPVYANATGATYSNDPAAIQAQLSDQLLQPVRFVEQIEAMYAEGIRVFIEFGPGNVLTRLADKILKDKDVLVLATGGSGKENDVQALMAAFCQLQVAGVNLERQDLANGRSCPLKAPEKSPMNMKLDAASFVSDKTRQAFEAALDDGQTLSTPEPEVIEKIVEKVVEVEKPVAQTDPAVSRPRRDSAEINPSVSHTVSALCDYQSDLLKVHETFMQSPQQYMQTVNQVLSDTQGQLTPELQTMLGQLNDYQTQTLQVHETFLRTQAAFTQGQSINTPPVSKAQIMPKVEPVMKQSQPAVSLSVEPSVLVEKEKPVAPVVETVKDAPAQVSVTPAVDIGAIMLQVVADKTGYPVDMLDGDMDMEADLGIDSIKRVEILGQIQDSLPTLPELNPEDLAELRTLGQISDHIQGKMQTDTVAAPMTEMTTVTPVATVNIDNELLTVVAEKTGYPVEMLDASMDMEADLGIDSIKRVEILGQIQDQVEGLPELEPEALAELRTLGEISQYIQSKTGGTSAPVPQVPQKPIAETGRPSQAIHALMLEVVAEKTGYPVEMIQVDMDLEADLGIDSIKRVEILGAVQDQLDTGMEIDPEAMGEMRTLQQITDYLQWQAPSAPAAREDIEQDDALQDREGLVDVLLNVVAEKTGYPVDMLELSMDMEADLGIDSIKRVEILGGVQDRVQGLPEADPEVLSEMRTLAAIVDYFVASEAASSDNGSQADNTHSAEVVADVDTQITQIKTAVVDLQPLPSVTRRELSYKGSRFLLVNDGSEQAGIIRDALESLGIEVTDFADQSTLKAQGFHGAVFCAAASTAAGFDESAKQVLAEAFDLARQLRLETTGTQRPVFITLTQLGGQLGFPGENGAFVQGGLSGLTKTLDQEWPAVYCRHIDTDSPLDATAFIDELFDADTDTLEVGRFANGRFSPGTAVTDSFSLTTKPLNPDSVFLVSGGAKGVTADCVIHLASQSPCHFILLGRSEMAEDPAWAQGITEDPALKQAAIGYLKATYEKPTPVKVQQCLKPVLGSREIKKTLMAIEAKGSTVDYLRCDVTDASDLQVKLDPVLKTRGAITGIIHGAGVLADKFIKDKTMDDFRAVFRTKVDGLQAMLDAVDPSRLSHLVLFSSAAGFYGNSGQADYAMANEVLNKAACRLKNQYPAMQVLSMNWGPWDGGMVTPEVKKMFAARGVDIIPVESGVNILVNELLATDNRSTLIVVGNSMRAASTEALPTSVRLKKRFNATRNPMLKDHVIGGNEVLPTVCAIAWMADAAESQYKGFKYHAISQYQLLKGIVIDDKVKDSYDIALTLKESSDSRLLVETVISTGNTKHYAGLVELLAEHAAIEPVKVPLKLVDGEPTRADALYRDGTLFHGESLQVVEQVIDINDDGLVLRCKVPDIALEKAGEFPVHQTNVFANDVAYQAMLIWVRKIYGLGSLPSATASWKSYRQIAVGEIFYVKLTVESSSRSKLTANIQLIDDQDVLIADIEAAEVTISERLNALFSVA